MDWAVLALGPKYDWIWWLWWWWWIKWNGLNNSFCCHQTVWNSFLCLVVFSLISLGKGRAAENKKWHTIFPKKKVGTICVIFWVLLCNISLKFSFCWFALRNFAGFKFGYTSLKGRLTASKVFIKMDLSTKMAGVAFWNLSQIIPMKMIIIISDKVVFA